MIINMTGGAGGGGLNFKVVQYTTTPTGTAKENTIGVVTDTAISGWKMQSEQPTGENGLVWIEVGSSSTTSFYADKKQQVKLYPKSVKQYLNGSWVNKEAYIYKEDKWVVLLSEVWLYNLGDEYTAVTGGWEKSSSAGTLTKNSEDMFFKSSTGSEGYVSTVNKIDTNGHNTLEVSVKTSSSSAAHVGVGSTKTEYAAKTSVAGAGNEYTVFTVPLEGAQGEYYVMFSTAATNAGIYVNSVRLV